MAKTKTQLVIFDFDGTLYDTIGGIHKAVNIVAKEQGAEEFDRDLVRSFVGYGLNQLLERLDTYSRHKLGNLEKMRGRFRQVYNQIALSESALFPGVTDFLDQWRGQLAIVSNKDEFSLKKMVEGSALSKYAWSALYGGDSFDRKKPDPLPVLKTLEGCNISNSEAVFVGDGLPDLMAAHAAQVPFVAVTFGYAPVSELKGLGATQFVSHFNELQKAIDSIAINKDPRKG